MCELHSESTAFLKHAARSRKEGWEHWIASQNPPQFVVRRTLLAKQSISGGMFFEIHKGPLDKRIL